MDTKKVITAFKKLSEKSPDIVTADYPDHPDDVVVSQRENIAGLRPVREIDVYNFYSGVKNKMLDEFRGRNMFIVVKPKGELKKGQKPVYIRHPYDGKTEYIRISNTEDFEVYHSGRTVEYHVTMPRMAPYYVVDFDAGNEPFSQTKKVTADVADGLKKLDEVKEVEIRYTGKRGFHILGWLNKPRDVDDAREFLKGWLKENFGDRDDVVVGESPVGKKGALGLSPMKINGGQVAKWSLRVSGLCCVEVPRAGLMSFEREDASIEKTYKKATGKAFTFEKLAGMNLVSSNIVTADAAKVLAGEASVSFTDRGVTMDGDLSDKLRMASLSSGLKISSRGNFTDILSENPEQLKVLARQYRRLDRMVGNVVCAFYNGEEQPEIRIVTAGYDREQIKPGYKGRFVIHDHSAERAGRHFDIRILFPVKSLKKALKGYGTKKDKTPEPRDNYPDKPGTVYRSFADRKCVIPEEGKKVFIVETEDHPVQYGSFEGTIPEGYGKGTVKIWDKGDYEILDVDGDSKYVFRFDGKKLKGNFAFIKYNKGFLWVKVTKEKDASIIDLPRKTLPEKLWDLSRDPPTLRESIRKEILNTLTESLENKKLFRPFTWINGLFISGSATGNIYKENGDVDIDITYRPEDFRAAYPEMERLSDTDIHGFIEKALYARNGKPIGSTPLTYSFMVLNPGDGPIADGIYDILGEKWIKGPQLVPLTFDPDEAFMEQRIIAENAARKIDLLIGYILRVVRDLKTLEIYETYNEPRPDKKKAMMQALARACKELDAWYNWIWGLSDSVRNPMEQKYPAFTYSTNWGEKNIIFKYLADRGYHQCVAMLYRQMKDDPYLDTIDTLIPD